MMAGKREKLAIGSSVYIDSQVDEHTSSGWVLSEVLGLISPNEAFGLDFWGSASRKLLVKAHYAVHASSICSSSQPLYLVSTLLLRLCIVRFGSLDAHRCNIRLALRRRNR